MSIFAKPVPSLIPGINAPLHALTLVAMGMPLIDAMDLEELARDASERSRWSFLFMAAPLKIRGGTGSPLNPLAEGPYSHRVVSAGEETFHVIAMELLSPRSHTDGHAAPRAGAAFEMALENPRGRAYRITLAPGESTGSFTRSAGTARFAVSAGRISESMEGKPSRLWDFEPADFRWFDISETLAIRNEGSKPIELVEIEILASNPSPGVQEAAP